MDANLGILSNLKAAMNLPLYSLNAIFELFLADFRLQFVTSLSGIPPHSDQKSAEKSFQTSSLRLGR